MTEENLLQCSLTACTSIPRKIFAQPVIGEGTAKYVNFSLLHYLYLVEDTEDCPFCRSLIFCW